MLTALFLTVFDRDLFVDVHCGVYSRSQRCIEYLNVLNVTLSSKWPLFPASSSNLQPTKSNSSAPSQPKPNHPTANQNLNEIQLLAIANIS